MLSLNAFLTLGLLVSMGLALYMAWENHQRFKLNNQIADELDVILHSVLTTIKEGKRLPQKLQNAVGKKNGGDLPEDINSAEMLSTILTVLIHKYGLARLSISDFKNVAKNEFVSVYVETETNDLILSLNHDLQKADTSTMTPFSGTTDDTFH